ncbi:MAG: peptidylprolyl isomerase [Erythrobacter sp.]|nr:peptidylprolyl isomerase [Erythrobacter sp.]
MNIIKTIAALSLTATLALPIAAIAQNGTEPPPAPPSETLSPGDIVNRATQDEWTVIAPDDLLVMTLAPDADGNPRTVILQLAPPPFSQGWINNIRTLARAQWYDGTSINRVQDNYVVQWGDPNYDNPETSGKAKSLPEGLSVMEEGDYEVAPPPEVAQSMQSFLDALMALMSKGAELAEAVKQGSDGEEFEEEMAFLNSYSSSDPSATYVGYLDGIPFGSDLETIWPTHCYGMVGVGRNYSPDTGSGAELYTVIGHAPRHLDRNIALVGRIIEGIEHLSSLPRGNGALGFYSEDEADKRTPILSIRVASDLPEAERPLFEYLSTDSDSFARYAEARANRTDPFFIIPAGGTDICNIPVPVRRFEYVSQGPE